MQCTNSAMPVVKESWKLVEEFLSPEVVDFDCHSSSIVYIGDVDYKLCAVWKGGPGKGLSNIDIEENVGIWSSNFDGRRWSAPREIVHAPNSVCWNPVLCKRSDNELLLFYRIGKTTRQALSFIKKSFDGGLSWGAEEILPAGIVGPTKNKPVVLCDADKTLICPSSMAVGEPRDAHKSTACWIETFSGGAWNKIGPLMPPGRPFCVVEPALFRDKAGNLKMFCRDRSNKIKLPGYIWESSSADNGRTWSVLTPTKLPNPDSAFDVADFGHGSLLLIYNHSHTQRFPLHVAISKDGGDHWSDPAVLDDFGEFPSAIVTPNGLAHVTYATSSNGLGQRRVKHVVIDPTKLF